MVVLRTTFIRASREPGVTLALVPFAVDQPTSLALAADALRSRLAPGEELSDLLPPIDSAIRSARATGGLVRAAGEARGIVLWEPAGPLGVAVRLLYLSPPNHDPNGYSDVLDLAGRAAGPIAFAPGPLAGLSEDEEAALMGARGFSPYGRSEMALPPSAPLPIVSPPLRAEVRPVRAEDESALARLHEAAYRGHLDRYLSLEDLDPTRDAERQLRDYFAGRWGELLVPGSTIVTVERDAVAATIACRRATGALILDVMTDPVHEGKGFGRAALAGTVRALRERREAHIFLNVTEGNDRALRLYSHLGFVRTLGPSKEWYDARRMPVERPRPVPRQPLGDGVGSGRE